MNNESESGFTELQKALLDVLEAKLTQAEQQQEEMTEHAKGVDSTDVRRMLDKAVGYTIGCRVMFLLVAQTFLTQNAEQSKVKQDEQ
jgi:hypothetical protein